MICKGDVDSQRDEEGEKRLEYGISWDELILFFIERKQISAGNTMELKKLRMAEVVVAKEMGIFSNSRAKVANKATLYPP